MQERDAIAALTTDLERQVDQLAPRGLKDKAGRPYRAPHFRRGLKTAAEAGGVAVADYVRGYVYRPPSDGYVKLEEIDALDLACEALVVDDAKPYAFLFTDDDRAAARERLAPHQAAIDERKAAQRVRIDAARARIRQQGAPRSELDSALRSRQPSPPS